MTARELRHTFFLGLVVANECTVGTVTSAILLCPRLMAMENGWSGRKYMGYVVTVGGVPAFKPVCVYHVRLASTAGSGILCFIRGWKSANAPNMPDVESVAGAKGVVSATVVHRKWVVDSCITHPMALKSYLYSFRPIKHTPFPAQFLLF